jgi:hypothetical protein
VGCELIVLDYRREKETGRLPPYDVARAGRRDEKIEYLPRPAGDGDGPVAQIRDRELENNLLTGRERIAELTRGVLDGQRGGKIRIQYSSSVSSTAGQGFVILLYGTSGTKA